MEKKFCCTNPECTKKNDVVKILSQESIMDEQNVAQMFCPECKSRLTVCEEESQATC
ncbi:MAG: hypothetical protein MI802_20445 [Desulfobacterales bacterium]|nr:hypothetical protein [Desulfobacterales bacterium]